MEKTRVLNIDALAITQQVLLDGLDRNLKGEGGNGVVITPNLDHLVKLQKDEEFYHCYQEAEWVVCDSKVLWLCSKLLKTSFPETIPGSSFFTTYYSQFSIHCEKYEAIKTRVLPEPKIFLLGARPGVAHTAMERINQAVGWNIVVGAHSPSYGFEKNSDEIMEISQIINESGANVVLVGVGAPKQEKFITTYRRDMPGVKIWFALGATIDFEAGYIPRAPKALRKLCLEWLFRIYCEPKRMFKRYICEDLIFFWYLLQQLLGRYVNPFSAKKSI